ncbi:biopolymer transporter ExbD [Pendulispora albinea]|uniref:Biopolymer transporter ExbD n=1 Tax=Pendulispora albinea TaxID=2741071 RepID=A0ABZ2LV86_9BACT
MAGMDLGRGTGARRDLNAEIQPIAMIDLMLVTISFLLITAAWSHMERVNASANTPSREEPTTTPSVAHKALHVEVQDNAFVLSWREGSNVVLHTEVPRRAEEHQEGAVRVIRYPELAAELKRAWESGGVHRGASERVLDRAVLHTPNALAYADVIAVIDAIHDVKRPMPNGSMSAFEVAFALD